MRVNFSKKYQMDFFKRIKKICDADWDQIAAICGVCPRTLRDWRNGKHKMGFMSLEKLSSGSGISPIQDIELIGDYNHTKAAGRKGALRRYQLYGNPGTAEGRSRGAKTTLKRFQSDPEYAKKVNFKVKRDIICPKRTPLLAEFIGIVLGDGGITKYQVKVTVNSKTDRAYAYFIRRLIKELFGISASFSFEKKNTMNVVASSKNLVDFLSACGLGTGNKVRRQVDIPGWIMKRNDLMRACLRGLVDTDGSIYFHTHITKGIKYRHIGLVFTNSSFPLLASAHNIFMALGLKAKTDKRKHVSLYDRNEIVKYMKEVGSHNKKHISRFKSYKSSNI